MTADTDPVPGAGAPTDGREPPPLSWQDMDRLQPTGRPGWLAREVRWLAFGAGLALVVLFVLVVPTGPCTATTPCDPDPAGALVIGMIISLPVLALIQLGFAAAVAGTAVVATLGYEQTQAEHLPIWFHLLFVGHAVGIGLLARLTGPSARQRSALRHWRPADRAVPPPARLPRPPLVPSVVAATLLVGAIVLAGWSTLRQNAADAQQHRAEVSTATVSDHRSPGDIELRFTDGRPALWIPVIDTADYPVGSTVDVLVDDQGLRQLVSEPYDLSLWLVPAALLGLAGLGLGRRVRAGMRARRRFFLEPQPLSTVTVDQFGDRVYIYAGSGRDARPVAEIEVSNPLTLTPHVVSDRGVLYGPPVPGHWGTVAIGGRILTPTGPLLPPTPPAPRIGPPVPLTRPEPPGAGATGPEPDPAEGDRRPAPLPEHAPGRPENPAGRPENAPGRPGSSLALGPVGVGLLLIAVVGAIVAGIELRHPLLVAVHDAACADGGCSSAVLVAAGWAPIGVPLLTIGAAYALLPVDSRPALGIALAGVVVLAAGITVMYPENGFGDLLTTRPELSLLHPGTLAALSTFAIGGLARGLGHRTPSRPDRNGGGFGGWYRRVRETGLLPLIVIATAQLPALGVALAVTTWTG